MRVWLFSEHPYLVHDFCERLNGLGFTCEVLSNICFEKWVLPKIKEEKGIILFICDNLGCCHLEKIPHIPVLIINSSFKDSILVRGFLHRNCSDDDLKAAIKETQALWK